jgi:hypothetical protein
MKLVDAQPSPAAETKPVLTGPKAA